MREWLESEISHADITLKLSGNTVLALIWLHLLSVKLQNTVKKNTHTFSQFDDILHAKLEAEFEILYSQYFLD